jgi:hypothetical protein
MAASEVLAVWCRIVAGTARSVVSEILSLSSRGSMEMMSISKRSIIVSKIPKTPPSWQTNASRRSALRTMSMY